MPAAARGPATAAPGVQVSQHWHSQQSKAARCCRGAWQLQRRRWHPRWLDLTALGTGRAAGQAARALLLDERAEGSSKAHCWQQRTLPPPRRRCMD